MKAGGRQAKGTPPKTTRAAPAAAKQAAAAGPAKTATRAPAPELATDPTGLLDLQRQAGNRAVRALLDGASSGDNRVAPPLERAPIAARIRLRTPPRSQAKLAIGRIDDEFEQEADRVADAVMRTATPPAADDGPAIRSAGPRIQRKCAACGAAGDEPCTCVQRKAESAPLAAISDHAPSALRTGGPPQHVGGGADAAPASVDAALARPGQPLAPSLRHEMEQRFGYDLSKVRLHLDLAAAGSAADVNARAYTVGHDIVFAANEFAPATPAGKRLLAHELTHVVQQRAGPMLQRQPAGPDDRGGPSAASGQAPCKPWPKEVPTRGTSELKPTGRDRAVEYSLAVTPGLFCDKHSKTLALVQYERMVRIRTQSGHEAYLHIVADAGLFPPFDRTKSDFQQLRAPADASLKWEVAIRFGKDKYWDWLVLPGAAGSVVTNPPRTQADLRSLAQIADTQPAFVHFFLPPARQQQELEAFVDRIAKAASPKDAHVAELEAPWRKKYLPKTEETLRPSPPERIKKPERSKEPDEATIARMSEDQRFDLARQKIWEGTKAKLQHMWQHPGETLKGFGASLLLLDTPEVFSAIGENLTELLDSDASPWARAAAGTEAAGKLSGWLAALLGGLAIIVGIIAFATGVGEVVAGILVVGALVAGAVSLALHGGASVLRAKAASKAKTAAEFNRHVEAGAGDLANGIAGAVVIIAGAILHATGKAVLPENVRNFPQNLGKRIRASRSGRGGPEQPPGTEPGAPAKTTGPTPATGATPKLPAILEKFLDQLQELFGPQPATAGGPGDVPVPAPGGMESRRLPPKRTTPTTVEELKPAEEPARPIVPNKFIEAYEAAQERARTARNEVRALETERDAWSRAKPSEGRRQKLEDIDEALDGARIAREFAEQDALKAEKALRDSTLPLHEKLSAAARQQPEFIAIRERANGIDRISGRKSNNLAVDHLVSIKRITLKRGFDGLSWREQLDIVNMRDNLVPMDGPANSSKGERTWYEWEQKKNWGYEDDAIKRMVEEEQRVDGLIDKEIAKKEPPKKTVH
jgi:hypothetical protein